MADIELVIKIPESVIEHLKDGSFGARIEDRSALVDAVMNGTPLPKGHGRIIDEGQITQVSYHEYISKVSGWQILHCFIDGTDAPTIIEADTESEKV